MSTFGWLFRRLMARRLRTELPRTLLALGGIALSVAVFVSIRAATDASVASLGSGFGGGLDLSLRHRSGPVDVAAAADTARTLSRDFIVRRFLEVDGTIDGSPVRIVGLEPLEWLDGSAVPSFAAARSNELTDFVCRGIGNGRASVTVRGRSVEQLAVTSSDDTRLPAGTCTAPLGTLQTTFGVGRVISGLLLERRPGRGQASPETTLSLDGTFPGWYLTSNALAEREGKLILEAFHGNLEVMVIVTLVVCTYTIANTARLSVLAVQEEMTVLRTLGMTRVTAALLVVAEQLFLGVLGAVAGLSLCRPLSDLLFGLFAGTAETLYGVRQSGLAAYSPLHVTTAIAAAAVTAAIGAVGPALSAAALVPRINQAAVPVEVTHRTGIRRLAAAILSLALAVTATAAWAFESPILAHSATAVLMGLVIVLAPALLELSGRIIRLADFRGRGGAVALIAAGQLDHRARSMGRGAGVLGIAMLLLVAMSFMITSFRGTLDRWVDRRIRADFFVRGIGSGGPGTPPVIPSSSLSAVAGVPGVEQIIRFGAVRESVRGRPAIVGGADIRAADARMSYAVLDGAIDADELEAGREVIVSEPAARKLMLEVGDPVRVSGRTFTVSAIFKEFSTEVPLLLLPFEVFRESTGSDSVNSLSIFTSPSADRAVVRAALERAVGPDATVVANAELRKSILEIFDRTFAITTVMEVVVMLIAGFGFTVLLLQNSWERRHEIRTVQILGFGKSALLGLFALESFALLIPATVLGSLGGLVLGGLLIGIVNPAAFGWTLEPSIGIRMILEPLAVAAAALVVSTALTTAWFGRRHRTWRPLDA